MNKYKVEYKQTETYIVDVYARDEAEAKLKSDREWNNGNYQQTGDIEITTGNIYDVTNTDDPFDAVEEPTQSEQFNEDKNSGTSPHIEDYKCSNALCTNRVDEADVICIDCIPF